MSESGFLVLARVEGVVRDEAAPGHYELIASSLLRPTADLLGATLRIEEIDRNALLATAWDGVVAAPAVLLDLMDQAYVAFRREQSRRESPTVCPCGACAGVSEVCLTFTLHHGSWTRASIGRRVRAQGADVAFVRLLSTVTTEARERILVTRAALDCMGVDDTATGGQLTRVAAEDGPDAECLVLNLEPAWSRAEHTSRPLEPRNTVTTLETFLPIPPVQAWDWLLAPDKRTLWEDVDTIASSPRADRRPGVGTRYHSEQGRYVDEVYEIVDWQPFRRWTWDLYRRGLTVRSTVELSAAEGGTRVVSRFGVAPGTGPVKKIRVRREVERKITQTRSEALDRLRQLLEVELREAGLGAVGVPNDDGGSAPSHSSVPDSSQLASEK